MGRSKASGAVVFVVLILFGVGWFALTWPYYVGGWFLEITYLFWLVYMTAMLAWYRHGRKPAASPAPAPLQYGEHRRGVIEPQRPMPVQSPARPVSAFPVPAPEPAPQLPAPPADVALGRERHPDVAIRLADLPPHGFGPILLDRLAAAGIRTYADYSGHRIDRSGARATVYIIRSDGIAVQVQGIGPDKAMTLDNWRAAARQGRLRNA